MMDPAVMMDPAKVSAICDWPVPTLKKDLHGFLGFFNFYHRFIKNFAQLAHPLNALTSIKRDFVWNNACQTVFTALKEALSTTPALAMSTDFDPYCIETDASGFGVGVVLSQCQDLIWQPIAFTSHLLIEAEHNYHTADLKMLVIMHALDEW